MPINSPYCKKCLAVKKLSALKWKTTKRTIAGKRSKIVAGIFIGKGGFIDSSKSSNILCWRMHWPSSSWLCGFSVLGGLRQV